MFANFWAILIGAGAALLPVLIHWLTRPRPTRLPVSTLRFIQGAVAQRRARYRLRDLIILFLRTAAVLLIAFAIARPLLHHQKQTTTDDPAEITRIVLLDCSQSMSARDGGIIRFKRAQPMVADLLQYDVSLKCNLLLAGASPGEVFAAPTTNLTALREALTAADVRPERLRVQEALNRISEMFETSDPESQRELIIISDFQRTNWSTADFSVLPEDCQTKLQSVASDEVAQNLAVLDVRTNGRAEAGREANVVVEVGNYSNSLRNVQLEVTLDNVVVPFEGRCPPKSRTTVAGKLPVSSVGWHFGQVRIVAAQDALPADDVRPFVIQSRPQPRLAVLTRDNPKAKSSAAWYIRRALAATRTTTAADEIAIISAADPDIEDLRAADIIVAARPGRINKDTLTVLTAMLQRGNSLLYIAADQLDAANLADLTNRLGSSLSMPVSFLPPSGERSGMKRMLTSVNRRSSPFVVFGDELSAAIGSLEFGGGLMSRPTAEGLQDDVRATLSDQSAFLTVTAAGRGRLGVLNADLERSNLARTPVLVPLLGELVTQDLTAAAGKQPPRFCGEPFTMPLDVGEESLEELRVFRGDDELTAAESGRFTAIAGGVVWDMDSAGSTNIYKVRDADGVVAAAVTSAPEDEADLRTLSAKVFEDRLAGGRQLSFTDSAVAGSEETQDTMWVWLATGCMLCLLLELLTLKLFKT